MNYDRVASPLLRAIVNDAEQKLGRRLLDRERRFIERRQALVGLQSVHDKVLESTPEEVERYLAGQGRNA